MNDQQKRARLRDILADPNGVIAPGVTDALFARLVQDCGYGAAHLSGNAIHKNFCLPDRNLLTVTEIAQRVGQISEATDIPLIVDGGPASVQTDALVRAVKLYERAGAAAIRFEDSYLDARANAEEVNFVGASLMADRIKAAADARANPSLVLIARCDTRPQESLDQVRERLALYVAAGADAVGVQLSDDEDFRQIGANAPAPLVSLWPKTQMSAFEFFRLGFRIALIPSSLPLAATTAAREMLLDLKQSGMDRDYFGKQKEFTKTETWYKNLGSTSKRS
jgi:2-methylisocitrate lyase-like PEP mutase family enzyme